MRVAFCLSGQARTLDICVASPEEKILRGLDYDVFASIANSADAGKIALVEPAVAQVTDDPVLK